MSNINYILSNKIRTILLTTIDKEILISLKKNNLLINSQDLQQLKKKYINYQNFTIKSEESFEKAENNEYNSIFFDLSCNNCNNKFCLFDHSSRTKNKCLLPKNSFTKSFSPKKNNVNTKKKKIKKSKKSESRLTKLKMDSRKKLISEMGSSITSKKIINFNHSESLDNNNYKKYIKKIPTDLNIYSINDKSDGSSKLINYCYKLKKPNVDIIDEISDDDTSTNKESEKNLLLSDIIKTKHKNIQKRKLKKIINNKKKIINKNNHNNDTQFLISSSSKKNIINFTNQMKIYFDYIEKSNPKEKMKIQYAKKRLSDFELKITNTFDWKKILLLHNCNSKSPENKSKGKKLKNPRRSFCVEVINKKQIHKKSQNMIHFKSFDNTSVMLKNEEDKNVEEKNEKKEDSISVDEDVYIAFQKKQPKSSSTLFNKNNEIFCFKKK